MYTRLLRRALAFYEVQIECTTLQVSLRRPTPLFRPSRFSLFDVLSCRLSIDG